jgi:hypothetical protein
VDHQLEENHRTAKDLSLLDMPEALLEPSLEAQQYEQLLKDHEASKGC